MECLFSVDPCPVAAVMISTTTSKTRLAPRGTQARQALSHSAGEKLGRDAGCTPLESEEDVPCPRAMAVVYTISVTACGRNNHENLD